MITKKKCKGTPKNSTSLLASTNCCFFFCSRLVAVYMYIKVLEGVGRESEHGKKRRTFRLFSSLVPILIYSKRPVVQT